MNSPYGVLSTASARSDLCFCLGLIDEKTHKNAKIIAKVRNDFAHSPVPIGFGQVSEKCAELHLLLVHRRQNGLMRPLDAATTERILSNPRYRFVLATCWTLAALGFATYNQTCIDREGKRHNRFREKPSSPAAAPGSAGLAIDDKEGGLYFNAVVLFDD